MDNRTGIINFVDFGGRANRFQYIVATFSLFGLIASGVVFWQTVWDHFENPWFMLLFRVIAIIFVGSFSLSWISLTVRRFHDIGKRWFFVPLMVVPIYNVYLIVILYFRAGEKRVNEFGPPVGS